MNRSIVWVAVSALLALIPLTASAHTGMGPGFGLTAGFTHPFSGLDHMLAMIAVGIWAIQMGGRSAWMVPLAFVSVMVLGGVVAFAGFHLPFVEQGIAASVIFLGLLILTATHLSTGVSASVVAFFALFHGFAHGSEMLLPEHALIYSTGFVLGTGLLHGAGIYIGYLIQQGQQRNLSRYLGGVITLGGLSLIAI